MSEDTNMHINVYTNQKDELVNSNKMSEEYIVKVNEQLTNINIVNNKKIDELRNKIDELETISDKQEVSIRYLRGILNNYVELKGLNEMKYKREKSINNILTKTLDNVEDNKIRLRKAFTMIVSLYIINNLLMCYCGFISIDNMFKCMCNFIFVIICSIDCYKVNFNIDYANLISSYELGIEEDNKKIEEIEKSNDFVGDYIDSI